MGHRVRESQTTSCGAALFLLCLLLNLVQVSMVKPLSFLVYRKPPQTSTAFLFHLQKENFFLTFGRGFFFFRLTKNPQMASNTLTPYVSLSELRNPNSNIEATTVVPTQYGMSYQGLKVIVSDT